MRSSKHSNKKGLFATNKKSSGPRRNTAEISEDFLAEFKELENIQRMESEKFKSKIENSNSRQNFNTSVQPKQRKSSADRSNENRMRSETIVFNKEELLNANESHGATNMKEESNMRFQKRNFNSEEFDKKVSENANYDSMIYDDNRYCQNSNQRYDSANYLGGTDNKSKKVKKTKKSGKNKKSKKESSSFAKKLRKVLIVLLLLIAVCVAGVFYYVDSQLDKLGHVETDVSEFEIDDQVKKDLKDYRNIAIMGVDARAGEDKSNTRTDAIIVASLNKETGNVDLISVMRDSYLEMDSSTGDKMYDKATHAHVYGGPVNTCKMLNKALDLNISEFVVMDWKSVADTVDALGGITVDVQQNEIWDLNHWGPETAQNTGRNWTQIYTTGEQRIDGVQAATYCRIRKNSGGDTGRTERMRKVVMAILKEVKEHPSKITSVADKVLPEVTTNMGTLDITTLLPQVINFEIKNNMGFPYNYYGGTVNGAWMAVPTTLSDNVKRLHEEAFKQTDYVPTARLEEISQNIINNTGISQGNEQ